jgi:sirohydrochlorin cobaltochelatase
LSPLGTTNTQTVALLDLQDSLTVASLTSWQCVAERLSNRLNHPVVLIPEAELDDKTESYRSQFEYFVGKGHLRFVIVPLGSSSVNQIPIQSAMAWLRSQSGSESYEAIELHLAHAWSHDEWAETVLDSVFDRAHTGELSNDSHIAETSRTNIVLVGEGTPAYAKELALLAYSLQQRLPELQVEYSFIGSTHPSISRVLCKSQRDANARLLILPWRLNSDSSLQLRQLCQIEAEKPQLRWLQLDFKDHPSIIHVLLGKYLSALHLRSAERYFRSNSVNPTWNGSLGDAIAELDRRIDSMLPSEYQGRTDEVKPTSMGSASLKRDSAGRVAWDEIWTSFCDLAMAGGPPHRGKLLEAVTREEVNNNLEAYRLVVQEIERGIEMVTGLPTVQSNALGWVGIACDDEQMACWLLRAIIVENVMVRREENILYVPAGPGFSIQREIKNVITSVAKTVHYWRAHLRMRDQ